MKRRRYWIPLIVCTAVAGMATPAIAAGPMPGWGAEIRLGPYQPRVGNKKEKDGYKDYFKDSSPLLKALEFDRYLYEFYGMVGVFGRVGHWKISGPSHRCRNVDGDVTRCGTDDEDSFVETSDVSAMIIVPLSMGAIYRFTYLETKLNIPLMVYAKAGLDYYLWWITANGETSTFRDSDGSPGDASKGGTSGFHFAAGLAFNLDWIESSAAGHKSFLDSYLFVEGKMTKANSFGNRDKPDMSANQIVFGLAFDFN